MMAGQRTAQGRTIDMATLAAKNEKVRAVGNMNVNARGDILDNNNNVIKDNTNRVKNVYRNTVTPGQQFAPVVPPAPVTAPLEVDAPVTTPKATKALKTVVKEEPIELTKEEAELFGDDEEDTK